MDISRYGKFSFTIDSNDLVKGLRPSKRNPRNSGYLVECFGAVGREGVLQVIDALQGIDASALDEDFPFPQIFVFTNVILVCTSTRIYEYDGTNFNEMLAVPQGTLWRAADFNNYIYMSNGVVAVVRDMSLGFLIDTNLPAAESICNFNGQVIIGTPKTSLDHTTVAPTTLATTLAPTTPAP